MVACHILYLIPTLFLSFFRHPYIIASSFCKLFLILRALRSCCVSRCGYMRTHKLWSGIAPGSPAPAPHPPECGMLALPDGVKITTTLGYPTEMAVSGLLYEPSARFGHVAAAVNGKLYLWGGMRSYLSAIHDGPSKTTLMSVVDVLDPQVF